MSVLQGVKKNDVVGVVYGDDPAERICRVMAVRNLHRDPILYPSRRPNVPRTDTLVTGRTSDGRVRSFYAGVEHSSRKIGGFAKAVLFVRRQLPKKVKA